MFVLFFSHKVTYTSYDEGLQMIADGKADIMLAAVVFKKDLLNVYYSHPYIYNW